MSWDWVLQSGIEYDLEGTKDTIWVEYDGDAEPEAQSSSQPDWEGPQQRTGVGAGRGIKRAKIYELSIFHV